LVTKVYIDTSVLVVWILNEEEPKKVSKLTPSSKNSIELLNNIIRGKLNCRLQTSDWAFSEMIQTFRDRAIFKQFFIDGFTISAFNRKKNEYTIPEDEKKIIHTSLNDFENFLNRN
jgi:hypothetical protein